MDKKKSQNFDYKKFHEISMIKKADQTLYSSWPESWKIIYSKSYPRFEKLPLIDVYSLPKKILKNNFFDSMFRRRTRRDFSITRKIGIKELSAILSGAGLTYMSKKGFKSGSLRAYPSAGARYPLEVYIAVLRPQNLKRGIYHYHVRTNSLEYMWDVSSNDLANYFSSQQFIKKSTAFIIISGVMNRTTAKYSDRGYRFVLIEAGHMAQNFSLIAETLKLKCCAIGGFLDDKVSDLLELSGDELALYGIALN